jgi:uncharacterized protein YgiM (DUF1202 family)
MKLRHEKTKKFVEDMVSHRTLALWVPGDVANRAKFDLRPVRQDLQSLVNRCKVPVHDPEGVPRRVTIASRHANIPTGPDVKSDVLGQATQGLSFPVVSEEREWLKIRYADKTGWVHLAVTERGKERKVKHAVPTLSAPPPRPGKSNETAESVYINVAVANIRSGPGKHYETMGQGTRGESLVVIGSHERWLNVEFRQQQAWVHKSIIANTPSQAQATEERLPNLKATLRRELDANLNNVDSGGYRIKGWFYNRATRKFIVYVHGGDAWLRGYAGNPSVFVPAIAAVAAVEFIFDDYLTTPRPQRYSFNQGTRELFKIDPNELLETIRGLRME